MRIFKILFSVFVVIAISILVIVQIFQANQINNLERSLTDLSIGVANLVNSLDPTDTITDPLPTGTADLTIVPGQTMTIKLYYKNYTLDPDVLDCSAESYVERTIPKTSTPLTDAINLLLTNELTVQEKTMGLETELFTTPASKSVKLISASVSNGTATIKLDDPNEFTSGGSCRSGILASQFSNTAKQFSTVNNVTFLPIDRLFQP